LSGESILPGFTLSLKRIFPLWRRLSDWATILINPGFKILLFFLNTIGRTQPPPPPKEK
jgi:hypothetical protein